MNQQIEQVFDGLSAGDACRLFKRIADECGGPDEVGRVKLLQVAWRMGATAMRNAILSRQICRICGCWELEACDGGCSWVQPDLCSACDTVSTPRRGADAPPSTKVDR